MHVSTVPYEHQKIYGHQDDLQNEIKRQDGETQLHIPFTHAGEYYVPVGTRGDQEHEETDTYVDGVGEEYDPEQICQNRCEEEIYSKCRTGETYVGEGSAHLAEVYGQEQDEQEHHQEYLYGRRRCGTQGCDVSQDDPYDRGGHDQYGLSPTHQIHSFSSLNII